MNSNITAKPQVSVSAYFCGHMNLCKSVRELMKAGWEERILRMPLKSQPPVQLPKEEDYSQLTGVFYTTFINSMANHTDASGRRVKLCKGYRGKAHLTKVPAVSKILIESVEVNVSQLHLFIMPDGMCLWAVHVDYTADAGKVTVVQGIMRSLNEKFHPVLRELMALTPAGTVDQLNLSGNKAKVFQRIQAYDDSDERLFEYGCMLEYQAMDGARPEKCFDRRYYDHIIGEHKVAVWADWTALALVDTFTVLGKNVSQWDENLYIYFRYIYISCLYQKVTLTGISRAYRSEDNARELSRRLRETVETNHWYGFTQISYNFLPQVIYDAIDKGLEISCERKELAVRVMESTAASEKESDRNTNLLLALLTVFSVLSVLFDLSQYLSQYWSFSANHSKWITIGLFILILLLYLLLRLLRHLRR